MKGTCQKHNREFELREGCPECLDERRLPPNGLAAAAQAAGAEVTVAKASFKMIEPVNVPAQSMEVTIRTNPELDESVVKLYNEGLKLQTYAEQAIIETPEDVKKYTNDFAIISDLKKAIEAKRVEYTRPINEHLNSINEAFNVFSAPIKLADLYFRQKVADLNIKLRAEKLEQERINQLRMEAAEAEMKLKGELSESVNLVEVVEPPKHFRADMGMTGMVDNWKAEVIDFALLPDEYKQVNQPLLNSAARSYKDKRTIPGVRIYNEPTVRMTRSK